MKDLFSIVGNYALNFIAIVVVVLTAIPNTFAQIILMSKSTATLKKASGMAFEDALNIDIAFNSIYKEFWQLSMAKTLMYEFGKPGETLSYAMKKNFDLNNMTIFGHIIKLLVTIVDFSTWFSGGHFNLKNLK